MKNSTYFFSSLLCLSAFIFSSCSSDNSSNVFSMENSFEMVFNKAKYSYEKKDSTLKIIKPLCKVGTLGNLVKADSNHHWDTLSYKAYTNKGIITLKSKDSTLKFSIEENSFPVGFWADPDYDSKKIQGGFRFEKKQLAKSVLRYDGSCFMKDYYALFRKGIPALEYIDNSLTDFYNRFKSSKDTILNEEEMLADIRVGTCDELTLYDGLVSVKVSNFKESSGKITAKYEKNACPITFNIRYAFEPKDCAASFADFENDKYAAKKFNFEDYSTDITYDEYCIEQLILDLKKANKIPLKTIAEKENLKESGKIFAKGLVDILLKPLH